MTSIIAKSENPAALWVRSFDKVSQSFKLQTGYVSNNGWAWASVNFSWKTKGY